MTEPRAKFECLAGCCSFALEEAVYACPKCGRLLQVVFSEDVISDRSAQQWKELFASRMAGTPGPTGSGVWRFHEWVLPDLSASDIVSLGEGNTPLVRAERLGEQLGLELLVKQCGQSLTGSFKDLGMTVLISQVARMRHLGIDVPAVACASTGDTSAALAAYGAAAGLRTLVLLPEGKITQSQLLQPLSHGARVIAIDTDFDGCMAHVQRLAADEGVYLANSKNSLRIEGQKTVAFEIALGLGWRVPDWIAIPGGNLGNVSALSKGFAMLKSAGLIDRMPRILCAQAQAADPLYRSFAAGFGPLEPQTADATVASAIRIGNPVSFEKAVTALTETNGVVASISEPEIVAAAQRADQTGLYVCPHTAVALAAVDKARTDGTIKRGQTVVTIATAHGLKFTELKSLTVENRVPGVELGKTRQPIAVADDYAAVRDAALEGL